MQVEGGKIQVRHVRVCAFEEIQPRGLEPGNPESQGSRKLKVSHLLRASQELGFAMYHAHLVHAKYGIAEMVERKYGSSDVKRPTPSPPPMDDFHDTIEEWSITNFLRLTGREHHTTTGSDIRDPDDQLTFARDVHETRPDDIEYEGDLVSLSFHLVKSFL
jgi:hypothetical protein